MAEGFPSVSAYRPASQALSTSGGDDHASLQAGKLLLAQGNRNAFGRVEIDPRTGLHTQLQALPNGSGKVSVEVNATIVTTEIKARLQFHDGQWRLAGYVADGVSEYVKRPISLNQKPEAEGYLSRSIGRQTLITDKRGKGITDEALARERVVEMIRHGGLTTKTHELVAQQRRSRVENSSPVVTGTTVKAYVPRVALPKPIAQMTMTDRLAYMRDVAWSTAGKNGLEELKSLTSPQSLFFMAAFAGAQTTPITSLMANGLATLMLGKDVIDTGGKLASSLQAGLTAKNDHELETAGLQMGEAAVHIGASLATGAVGKQVARVAKNYRETASTRVLERTLVDYKAGKASEGQLRAAVIAASQDQGVRVAHPLVPKNDQYERATGAVKPSTAPATPTPKPTSPPVITMVQTGKNTWSQQRLPNSAIVFGQKALPPAKAATIKAEASKLLRAATGAQQRGDLAGFTAQIRAMEKLQATSAGSGQPALAEALGVHVKNLDARRKAMQWKLVAPMAMAGAGGESASAAVARIGAMTGTPRQRSYEAQVYLKSQLKSESEIDNFAALLKADTNTNAVAKDPDFQRAVGQAKRALVADTGIGLIRTQLANCKTLGEFNACKRSLAQQPTRSPGAEAEVQKIVRARATDLADELVSKVQSASSWAEFYTLIRTEYRPFASRTPAEVSAVFKGLLGEEGGAKLMGALVAGAKKYNTQVPVAQLARSLAPTIKASAYEPHIVAEIKRRAPAAEWPAIRAQLLEDGVGMPSDDVLDHIVSVNVPKGLTTDTYRHAAAVPKTFAEEMTSAEEAILRPLKSVNGRVVTASPAAIMRDPMKHLQKAFPELSPEQLRNIFRRPGTSYTKNGAPTIERTRFPQGLVRPAVDSAGNATSRGALEEVFGNGSRGQRVLTGYMLDERLVALKPQSRAGAIEPYVLFRGDARSPQVIADKGMLARGRNLDPVDHVYSNMELGDSAYIATTESRAVAMSYRDEGKSYVYVIRNQGSISKDFSVPRGFGNEYEHLIPGGVKPEDILGYYEVTALSEHQIVYSKLMRMPEPAPAKVPKTPKAP